MAAGLHIGAQAYVSRGGHVVGEIAIGQSRPGVAMTVDTLMAWMSGSKPFGAVAIAQLWERGQLRLDDPIALHIPEFAQHGKSTITIRHVLSHTAGIRWVETGWPAASWDQIIATICAMRPERDWTPGHKAGYSALVSWFVLGEIVRRRDGRAYADYVRDEIFRSLGMHDAWIAMPPEVYHGYGTRLGILQKTENGQVADGGHDTEAACTRARPSSSGHGPARLLGRFYEALLAGGTPDGAATILRPQTVEALVARHRAGLYDHTFKHVIDFGLGFVLNTNRDGEDAQPYGYGPFASRRTYGHGGFQSLSSFADPEHGIAAAIICNGTPGEVAHHRRMRDVHAALYQDLGLA